MLTNKGIPHFGQGGMFDYLLAEIAFCRYLMTRPSITGEHHKGEAEYEYDAPFYYWDKVMVRYSQAIDYDGLKFNRQELRG